MIVNTITDNSYFYQWLQSSDNYKNNFSYDGANALQEYLDNLSDELDESIEFDPIAWCCEFSEYENLKEVQSDYDVKSLDNLKDNTIVIELDNGGLVIQSY